MEELYTKLWMFLFHVKNFQRFLFITFQNNHSGRYCLLKYILIKVTNYSHWERIIYVFVCCVVTYILLLFFMLRRVKAGHLSILKTQIDFTLAKTAWATWLPLALWLLLKAKNNHKSTRVKYLVVLISWQVLSLIDLVGRMLDLNHLKSYR